MSFEAESIDHEAAVRDNQEKMIRLLKVIAFLLADQQDENLIQLLNDFEDL